MVLWDPLRKLGLAATSLFPQRWGHAKPKAKGLVILTYVEILSYPFGSSVEILSYPLVHQFIKHFLRNRPFTSMISPMHLIHFDGGFPSHAWIHGFLLFVFSFFASRMNNNIKY